MTRNRLWRAPLLLVAAATALALAGAAAAHHGWSDYDASKTLDFAGEVRESSFGNPHGTLKLEVRLVRADSGHELVTGRPFRRAECARAPTPDRRR